MFHRKITKQDQQLLCAALCQDAKAEEAWRAWRASLDFDKYGPRYMSFIPLLYENLQNLGIDDPLCGKFKGIQRRILYKNQLRLRQVSNILRLWQKNDIKPLCLGDIALASHYYANLGLRPIWILQFLIRPEQIDAAAQLLQDDEWNLVKAMQNQQSYQLKNSEGLNLSLFTRVASFQLYPADDNALWSNRVAIQIHDVKAHTIDPTAQLFDLCTQPFRKHFADQLWIADALMLLNSSEVAIDWERITSASVSDQQRRHLHSALSELLKYDAPIPSEVVQSSRPSRRPIGRILGAFRNLRRLATLLKSG